MCIRDRNRPVATARPASSVPWHRRCCLMVPAKNQPRRSTMLGRLLVAAIAGVVVWKYRDSIREYAQGNAGPAREKLDGILGTMKDRSETLLDQAKDCLLYTSPSPR